MTLPPGTPPGWRSDPGGAPMLRWWDGNTWTEHVTATPNPSAPYAGGYGAPSPTSAPSTSSDPFATPAQYNLGYAPGGMAAYPMPPQTGTNGLAIASLICSLVGLLCCIGSIAGLITGFIALDQLKNPQNQETGRGLALAGIIIGVLGIIAMATFVSLRVSL
jgi:hypothetical protein